MDYWIRNIQAVEPPEFEDWWRVLLAEGVVAAVFPDLPVKRRNLNFWRRFAEEPDYEINLVYGAGEPIDGRTDNYQARLAMFWLAGRCGRTAFLNFGFLKAGLKQKEAIGRYVLGLLWYAGYESLASLTPAYNLAAIRYARSLGGRVMGRWPGACPRAQSGRCHDGVLIQFLADDFSKE